MDRGTERDNNRAKHIIIAAAAFNVVMGLVLYASPFLLTYHLVSPLTTVNVILGTLIGMFAAFRLCGAYDAYSISLITILLGLITIATPWWMHATLNYSFVLTHLICGITVTLSAVLGLIISHRHRPMKMHTWRAEPL